MFLRIKNIFPKNFKQNSIMELKKQTLASTSWGVGSILRRLASSSGKGGGGKPPKPLPPLPQIPWSPHQPPPVKPPITPPTQPKPPWMPRPYPPRPLGFIENVTGDPLTVQLVIVVVLLVGIGGVWFIKKRKNKD
jgi:LPXTG-motif cell wall-anchored protein